MSSNLPFTLVLAVVLIIVRPPMAIGDDVSMDQIVAAWRSRQKRTQSVMFDWKAKMTYAQGSLGSHQPPNDLTYFDPSVILMIDGVRIRYEHQQMNFKARLEGKEVSRYISTFDGEVSADHTTAGSKYDWAIGIVSDKEEYNDIGNLHLRPVLLWCRPFYPKLRSPDDFRITEERPVVDGREVVVIKTPPRGPGLTSQHCWVDPKRDFCIVRWQMTTADKLAIDVTIRYREDAVHSWVPSSWAILVLNPDDGKLQTASHAEVTQYTINEPIVSKMFQLHLQFPIDTVVTDRRSKERYFVRADGRKRLITESEENRGFTLQELKTTKSGDLVRTQPTSWRWRSVVVMTNVVILSVIAVLMIFRKFRTSRELQDAT